MVGPGGSTRRKLLKLTGATSASLSGLAGFASASENENAERLAVGEQYVTRSGERITVDNGAVKQSLLYLEHLDAPRVHGYRDSAYVFGDVRSSIDDQASMTSRSEYRIIADERTSRPADPVGPVSHYKISQANDDVGPVFDPDREDMPVSQRTAGGIGAYVSTKGGTDTVGVGYVETGKTPDVIWEFGQDAIRTFNSVPNFSVTDFDIDGPISLDDRTTASIGVENSGDLGTFRAVIGVEGTEHPRAIERTIDARSSVDFSVPINFPRVMGPSRRNSLQSGQQLRFVLVAALADSTSTTVTYREGQQ